MSSAITETPGTWPTSVTAPDGTDVVSITALRNAMEDINDRVLRTRQSLGMAIVAGAGTSTTRVISAAEFSVGDLGNGAHHWSALGLGRAIRQETLSANVFARKVITPEIAPHGATVTSITARLIGASGHGGLPANMPDVMFYKYSVDGSYTSIGTATDSSGTVGAYEANHAVTLGSMSEVLDYSTYSYEILVSGEASTNAADDLDLTGASITYTPPV